MEQMLSTLVIRVKHDVHFAGKYWKCNKANTGLPCSWELGHWHCTVQPFLNRRHYCQSHCAAWGSGAKKHRKLTVQPLCTWPHSPVAISWIHSFTHSSIHSLINSFAQQLGYLKSHIVPLTEVGITDAQRDFQLFPLSRHIPFEAGFHWLPRIGQWNMSKGDKCDFWTK